MDLIQNNTPYAPRPGVQQTGPPIQPTYFGAAGIGPRLVTNYKKALWPGEWSTDPIKWLQWWNKVWNYYGIYTPEQIGYEFKAPSKLLTFAILAADTESEDYMARYIGLVDDWRTNVHQVLARSLPINRYASQPWDPRFDPNVGYAVIPSVDDPRFEQKLAGEYYGAQPGRRYERIEQVRST